MIDLSEIDVHDLNEEISKRYAQERLKKKTAQAIREALARNSYAGKTKVPLYHIRDILRMAHSASDASAECFYTRLLEIAESKRGEADGK